MVSHLVVEAVALVAVAPVAEAAVAVDGGGGSRVGTVGASVAVGVGVVAVGGGHQGALVHGVHVGPRGGHGGDGPHDGGGVVSPGGGVAVSVAIGTVAQVSRLGSSDGHQEGDANLQEYKIS